MTSRFSRSEKSTDHFVKSQFPDFFLDEGEGIVNFIDAYYKHQTANTHFKMRDLQIQGDIDTTSNTNLIRFNNKYTFGSGRFIKELPAVITGDLRFIIKHIKDLYRSKGTERGTKLFFRLAFNDSPEVFVPGTFLFRPSDSIYTRPILLEVSLGQGYPYSRLVDIVGTDIVGSVSGSSAVAKNVFKKIVDKREIAYIEIENVNGSFVTGDKIVSKEATQIEISSAPKVTGPIDELIVENGSTGIPLGTVFTALPVPDGTELKASVTSTEQILGTFKLRGVSGYGYTNKSQVIISRAPGESSQVDRGQFSVSVDNIFSTSPVNGDLIKNFEPMTIGDTTFNGTVLDSSDSGNAFHVTPIGDILSTETRSIGSISNIKINIDPKNYNGVSNPFIAIKDITFSANQSGNSTVTDTLVVASKQIFSNSLITVADTFTGNVTISGANNKVVGYGTDFLNQFVPFDVIKVMNSDGLPTYHNIESISNSTFLTLGQNSPFSIANTTFSKGFVNFVKLIDSDGTEAVRAVNNVVNSTAVYIDDKILTGELNSNPSYTLRIGYDTSNVNFSSTNDKLQRKVKSGTTFTEIDTGENANFNFNVTSGTGAVSTLNILNCGFGYSPGEEIIMRSEDLAPFINIIDNEGKGTGASAVPVLSGGEITSIIVTSGGSGYVSPSVTVEGGTGSGALLSASLENGVITNINVSNTGLDYLNNQDIIVKVKKGGQSILEGRHSTISSEPNPSVRLQDSNFWQEYSYEIQSSIDNTKYENVVDNLIHMSGRKFFTLNLIKDDASTKTKILEESVTATGV